MSHSAAVEPIEFAIALHGGAGLVPTRLSEAEQTTHRQSLAAALEVGRKLLTDGGTALDAVEQTIRFLEDDPLFNAGRGSVFNSIGKHELDASIMDGKTGGAGAVASLSTVKNPISLARLVMTETQHVLLSGEGAEQFADEMQSRGQIERVDNDFFSSEARHHEWQAAVDKVLLGKSPQPNKGTVGCVARDRHGNLAAGTSTGGLTNKKWGRIGDSPIIGAGTYANNATCAVSCTGTGEYFIRGSVAFHVSALMAYKSLSLADAVRHMVNHELPANTGGLIAVDRHGRISMLTNTAGMARAAADSTGWREIALGK